MTEQRYSKKEPALNATYKTIREFYGREEYFKRFFKRLYKSLISSYGQTRADSIYKLIGNPKVQILGFEKFYTIGSTLDVGTSAYMKCKDKTKNAAKRIFIEECKKRVEEVKVNGEQDVDVTPAFIYLAQLAETQEDLQEYGKVLIDLFTTYYKNPFILKLFTQRVYSIKKWKEYAILMGIVSKTVRNSLSEEQKNFPKLHRVFYIFDSPKRKVISYLQNLYTHNFLPQSITDCFKDVTDLTSYELDVCEAFEKAAEVVNREKPYGEWMHDHVVAMLTETTFTTFLSERSKAELCRRIGGDFVKDVFARMEAVDHYLWQDSQHNGEIKSPFLGITFNCKQYSNIDSIFSVLDNLVLLSLEKERASRLGNVSSNLIHKIVLEGFTGFNRESVDKIGDRIKKLRSKYNKEIEIEIEFDPSVVESRTGVFPSEYLRVVSDLHIDVNGLQKYEFDFGTDFVLNCGDTSGNSYLTKDFIQTHTFNGIAVAGNHLGYDSIYSRDGCPAYIPEDEPLKRAMNCKNRQLKYLRNAFSLTNEVSFLENDGIERMGIYFYGATLYTDFSLFGEKNEVPCMMEASRRMNDFKRCTYLKRDKNKPVGQKILVEPWTVEKQKIKNRETRRAINYTLVEQTENNPDMPIVIVTHYAPTSLAITDQYKNDPLSASFAVDMTYLIDKFPQIRLFAFGHVHAPFDFIYKGCRFVCNPFGYFNENNANVSEYGTRIKIADIKSGEPWEKILENEIKEGLVKVYK